MRARNLGLAETATLANTVEDWRWRARRVLSRFGSRTIPALVEALSSGEDPSIRRFAIDSLARLGPEARSASEALHHAAWHDPDPSVRAAAAAVVETLQEATLSE